MQSFDDYGWKEEKAFDPGKLSLAGGNWPKGVYDRKATHPLFSINGAGRTLEPPYLILAMEV